MDKNNDVVGALAAYREAVARLKNVMERVGVEASRDDPKRRRSTVGKSEEEGRTLRGIVSLPYLTGELRSDSMTHTLLAYNFYPLMRIMIH